LSKITKTKSLKLDTATDVVFAAGQEHTYENLGFAGFVLESLLIGERFPELKNHHGNQKF